MADLHMAINISPFGWYAYNMTLDKNKVPVDITAVLRTPDQIKISVTARVEGKEKEIAFYVTPCSAASPEEFLLYTWDQYMKLTKAKLPASLREDGPTYIRLFPLALGVSATNAWNKVLEENGVNTVDDESGGHERPWLQQFHQLCGPLPRGNRKHQVPGGCHHPLPLARAKKPLEASVGARP
eukprot:scaffold1315_cov23-Cyclotella_meneghiniana.AAC.5